jgi:hypothetical protein
MAFCNGPGDVKSPRVIVTPPSSRFCPCAAPMTRGMLCVALCAARIAAVPPTTMISTFARSRPPISEGIERGMRDLGYVEGRNIAYEFQALAKWA